MSRHSSSIHPFTHWYRSTFAVADISTSFRVGSSPAAIMPCRHASSRSLSTDLSCSSSMIKQRYAFSAAAPCTGQDVRSRVQDQGAGFGSKERVGGGDREPGMVRSKGEET